MTTVDIPLGTIVYVNWYGKTLPAETIDRKGHCDWPPLADWIPVRMVIPNSDGKPVVEGCRNISIYHMRHVYSTPDEAQQAWKRYQEDYAKQRAVTAPTVEAPVPVAPSEGKQTPVPVEATTAALDVHRERYLQFKADNWDASRNHLRIDALDAFYALFREGIRLKMALKSPSSVRSVSPVEAPPPVQAATTPADSSVGNPPPVEPPKPQQSKKILHVKQLTIDFQF